MFNFEEIMDGPSEPFWNNDYALWNLPPEKPWNLYLDSKNKGERSYSMDQYTILVWSHAV